MESSSFAKETPVRLLDEAIRLSLDNVLSGAGGPFGAVVARGERIVGSGSNQVTATNDPTAHAEVVAIRAACRAEGAFELRGCVLYSSCEPCPMCLAACYWARLDAVFFAATREDAADAGFDDAFLYRELALPNEGRALRVRPMPECGDAARSVFQTWRVSENKREY